VETDLTKEIKYELMAHYRTKRDMHVAQECGNMDVLAISKEGVSYEFEVKISKSDLVADKKKRKHSARPKTHFFYYVVPPELSEATMTQASKLSPAYGVIVYNSGCLEIIKRAKKRKTGTNLEHLLYGNISYAYVLNYKKVCLYEQDREKLIPQGVSKKAETIYRHLLKIYSIDTVALFVYNRVSDVITYDNKHTIVFKPTNCYVGQKIVSYKSDRRYDSWTTVVLQGVSKWINESKKGIVFTM